MHFVRDMSFGRDMRYARWKKAANRISLRPSGAISLLRSKNITPSCARHITKKLYHPTLHPKGVTHYTLQGNMREKEYDKFTRTPFVVFAVSKICFMVGIRCEVFSYKYKNKKGIFLLYLHFNFTPPQLSSTPKSAGIKQPLVKLLYLLKKTDYSFIAYFVLNHTHLE